MSPSDETRQTPGPEQDAGTIRHRISARGEEAIGDVAQTLLENPLFSQAIQVAFGARDAASQATSQAMKNLNVATSAEVERLERRLRAVSDRLESVEDKLDEIVRAVTAEPPSGSTGG